MDNNQKSILYLRLLDAAALVEWSIMWAENALPAHEIALAKECGTISPELAERVVEAGAGVAGFWAGGAQGLSVIIDYII